MEKIVLGLEILGGEIAVTHDRVQSYYTHAHVYHELLFYDAFDGYVTVNQTRIAADTPLTVLVTPTDFHSTGLRAPTAAQYLKIAFRDDFGGSAFAGRLMQPIVLRDFPSHPLLAALKCRCESGEARSVSRTAILLNAMLLALTEDGTRLGAPVKKGSELLALRAMQEINTHFAEELPLTAVADVLHVSPQHLSATFSACVGVPYSAYLRAKRLRYAAALLAAHDGSVTEICYRSGFANLSHFIRCFENQFGVPPGAYARKEREKET